MLNGISSQFSGISSNMFPQQKPPGGMDPGQKADEFAANLIEELDSDGDGALSMEEAGIPEEIFAEVDSDGDGLITSDEIKADMQSRHEAMKSQMMDNMVSNLILELDSDGDGALSVEEAGISEEVFTGADTDGDGLITSDEIKTKIQSNMESVRGEMPANGRGPGQLPPMKMSSQTAVQTYQDILNSLLTDLAENEDNSGTNAYAASISGTLNLTA